MSIRNGKVWVIFLMTFFAMSQLNFSLSPNETKKRGLDEFIKFLNSEKDTLKYKNFGILEHENAKEVRIHCTEETLGKIMDTSDQFGYEKISVAKTSKDSITVVVIFLKEDMKPTEKPKAKAPQNSKKKKCPRKVKVQVQDINTETFKEFKYFKKQIFPGKKYVVLSPSDEKIVEILAQKGDAVTKDQVLIKFDEENINNEIQELDIELEKWKKILFKREHWKVRSPKAEEQAKRKIQEAEAQIAEKQKTLSQLQVKSPTNGTVTFIADQETGAPKDKPLFDVLTPEIMKIKLPLGTKKFFKEGQMIKISFAKSPLKANGQVEFKPNAIIIYLNNEALTLKEGQVAKFKILLETHDNAIVLTPDMLLKDEEGKFVFVVNGKFAKKARLELGPKEKGKFLVRSGLDLEDKIITTGIECLEDGKRIKVVMPKPDKKAKKKTKPPKKEKKKPVKVETETFKEPTPTTEPPKPKKEKPKKTKLSKEKDFSDTNKLRLSFGVGSYMVNDEIFKEVYGSSAISGYLELGYSFTPSIEAFAAAAYISKKGSFTEFGDEVTLTMMPMYVGGKFKFNTSGKLKPYVGAALAIYNMKEKAGDQESPTHKGTGFALLGGAVMKFSPNLGLFLDLKYDSLKIEIEEIQSELDFSGLRLTLGLSYQFKLF